MVTAYITHPDCLLHEMGAGHPESPQRLQAIEDQLLASGMMEYLRRYEAPQATQEQLLRVHDARYVQQIHDAIPAAGYRQLDPDTAMNPFSLRAALHAAGAVVQATDLVMAGEADNAFCAVRPPGHHAEPDHAMGFCLFNNVAVGVAHALHHHGLQRVAIVDFDVHHGNGTETMFRHEPRVLFCSSFQHPHYPNRPLDPANRHMVQLPLPAGTDGSRFRQLMTKTIFSRVEAFAPQMIFVSAGFDGHREDPLAQLALDDDDYGWLGSRLAKLAGQHASGRLVSTLEGGYALPALGRAVHCYLQELRGSWLASAPRPL